MSPRHFPGRLFQVATLCCLGLPVAGAPANLIYYCTSAKIEPATVNSIGQHRLSFSFSDTDLENGELALLSDADIVDTFRGTYFTLTAPGLGVPVEGFMNLDTPQKDANFNGIDDIFEVAQVQPPASTTGTLEITTIDGEMVTGTVAAQWQRAAGQTRGTVQIAIAFPGYSRTFLHNFEVYQYSGTMDYTRSGTNVNATVNLSRVGSTGTLAGPWALHVEGADSLTQDGGAWVAGKPNLKFNPTITNDNSTSNDLTRGGLRNNYFGNVLYDNGSPIDDTPTDFALWEIHLFDPNDADGDHIPDLTDPDFTGQVTPPSAPQISVTYEASAPRLHLTGTPGVNYVVEQKDSLAAPAWISSSTNQPAANGLVDVPLSTKGAGGARFWRARAL